jgi:hypothetical protein
MPAARLDLTIEQGTTFRRKLTIRDTAGTLVNLTGYTFRGQIRARYDSPSALAAFAFTLGNQTTNTGEVTMELTALQTAALPVDPSTQNVKKVTRHVYDIEMVAPSGDVARILDGQVVVSPEVTQ